MLRVRNFPTLSGCSVEGDSLEKDYGNSIIENTLSEDKRE